MKRDIRSDTVYPHSLERVWRALTDFQPRLGHKFQFRTKPAPGFDGIVNCEVVTGFRGARAVMVSFIMGSGWTSKILPKRLPDAVARMEQQGYRPLAADGVERYCH